MHVPMLACSCCTPGRVSDRLCLNCFKVWYDSGITDCLVLAREVRWRKAEGFWPWSDKLATVAQIEEMERGPLPDAIAEGEKK